jgi:DNA primase catalytic core
LPAEAAKVEAPPAPGEPPQHPSTDASDETPRAFGTKPDGQGTTPKQQADAQQTQYTTPVSTGPGEASDVPSALGQGPEEYDEDRHIAALLDVVDRAFQYADEAANRAQRAAERASTRNEERLEAVMHAAHAHWLVAEHHHGRAREAHADGQTSQLEYHASEVISAAVETQHAAGVAATADALRTVLEGLKPAAERARRAAARVWLEAELERMDAERDRELTAVTRMDAANRDRLQGAQWRAESAVPELGWWPALAADMAHAYQGRLWLDETGTPRLLKTPPDGLVVAGRKVNADRVAMLRAAGFLVTGTGSETSTPLRPSDMGREALYLATLYPEGLYADARAAYDARYERSRRPRMNNEERKRAARRLPPLDRHAMLAAREKPVLLEDDQVPQIGPEKAPRHADMVELAQRFWRWAAMSHGEKSDAIQAFGTAAAQGHEAVEPEAWSTDAAPSALSEAPGSQDDPASVGAAASQVTESPSEPIPASSPLPAPAQTEEKAQAPATDFEARWRERIEQSAAAGEVLGIDPSTGESSERGGPGADIRQPGIHEQTFLFAEPVSATTAAEPDAQAAASVNSASATGDTEPELPRFSRERRQALAQIARGTISVVNGAFMLTNPRRPIGQAPSQSHFRRVMDEGLARDVDGQVRLSERGLNWCTLHNVTLPSAPPDIATVDQAPLPPIDYTPLRLLSVPETSGEAPLPPAPAPLPAAWHRRGGPISEENEDATYALAAEAAERAARSTARDVAALAAGADHRHWTYQHPLAQYDENAAAALETVSDPVTHEYATRAVLNLRAALEEAGKEATDHYVQNVRSPQWKTTQGVQADDVHRGRVTGIVVTYLLAVREHAEAHGLDANTIVNVLEDAAGWTGELRQLGNTEVRYPLLPAAESVAEAAQYVANALRAYALGQTNTVDTVAERRTTWRTVEPRPAPAELTAAAEHALEGDDGALAGGEAPPGPDASPADEIPEARHAPALAVPDQVGDAPVPPTLDGPAPPTATPTELAPAAPTPDGIRQEIGTTPSGQPAAATPAPTGQAEERGTQPAAPTAEAPLAVPGNQAEGAAPEPTRNPSPPQPAAVGTVTTVAPPSEAAAEEPAAPHRTAASETPVVPDSAAPYPDAAAYSAAHEALLTELDQHEQRLADTPAAEEAATALADAGTLGLPGLTALLALQDALAQGADNGNQRTAQRLSHHIRSTQLTMAKLVVSQAERSANAARLRELHQIAFQGRFIAFLQQTESGEMELGQYLHHRAQQVAQQLADTQDTAEQIPEKAEEASTMDADPDDDSQLPIFEVPGESIMTAKEAAIRLLAQAQAHLAAGSPGVSVLAHIHGRPVYALVQPAEKSSPALLLGLTELDEDGSARPVTILGDELAMVAPETLLTAVTAWMNASDVGARPLLEYAPSVPAQAPGPPGPERRQLTRAEEERSVPAAAPAQSAEGNSPEKLAKPQPRAARSPRAPGEAKTPDEAAAHDRPAQATPVPAGALPASSPTSAPHEKQSTPPPVAAAPATAAGGSTEWTAQANDETTVLPHNDNRGVPHDDPGMEPEAYEDGQADIGTRILGFADHVLQTVSANFGLGDERPVPNAATTPDNGRNNPRVASEETAVAESAKPPAPSGLDAVSQITAMARASLSNLGAAVSATGVLTAPGTALITLESTGDAQHDRDLAATLRKAVHDAIKEHPDQRLASYRIDVQHTTQVGQGALQEAPGPKAALVPRERLIAANNAATRVFAERLRNDPNAELARTYLAQERHLPAQVQQEWGLGYAPSDRRAGRWDLLVRELTAQGFTEDELLQAGLAKRSSRDTLIDYFDDRIMFPIHDEHGDIVGFSGRRIDRPGETEEQAKERQNQKYFNTSNDAALFSKGDLVFGLHHPAQAESLAGSSGPRVSVEGYLDVIAVARASATLPLEQRPVVGAPMGTAFTERQLAVLRGLDTDNPRPHIAFLDADDSGRKVLIDKWGLLVRAPGPTAVTTAPDAKDAAKLWEEGIKADGDGAGPVLRALEQPQPLLDAVVEAVLIKSADETERANHAFDSSKAFQRTRAMAAEAAYYIHQTVGSDYLHQQGQALPLDHKAALEAAALTWAKRLYQQWSIPGHMTATAVLLGPGNHSVDYQNEVYEQALDLLATDPEGYFDDDSHVRSRQSAAEERAASAPASPDGTRLKAARPGQWPAGTRASEPVAPVSTAAAPAPSRGELALSMFLPSPVDGQLAEHTDRTTAAYALHTAVHERLGQHTAETPEPDRLPQPLKLGTVHGVDLSTSADDQTGEDPTVIVWLGPSRSDSLRLSYSRFVEMTGPELLAAVEWRAAQAAGLLGAPLSQNWRDAVRSILPPQYPAQPTPGQLADLLDTIAQSPDGSDERIQHRAEQAVALYTAGHSDLALNHLAAYDHIWVLRNDGSWIQEEAPGHELSWEELDNGFSQEAVELDDIAQAAAELPPGDQVPMPADLTVAHHSAHEALAVLRPYSIGLPNTLYEKITELVDQMDAGEPALRRLHGPDGEQLMNRAKRCFVRVLEGLATVASKIRLTGLGTRLERTVARLRGQDPDTLPAPREVRTDRRMQDLSHIERDLERRMAAPTTTLAERGELQEQWIINRARWRARYEQLTRQPPGTDFLPDNGLVAGAPPVPNLIAAHDLLLDRLGRRVAELRDTDPHTGEESNSYDPTADLFNGVAWAYQQRLIGTVPIGEDPQGPIPAAQLRQAALIVTSLQSASPLTLRRALNITAERADRLLHRLEEHLVLGPYRSDAPRTVLARPSDIDTLLARPATPPALRKPAAAPAPAATAPGPEPDGADPGELDEARIHKVVSKIRADQQMRSETHGEPNPADSPAPASRVRKNLRTSAHKEAEANALTTGQPTSLAPSQT